MTDQEKIENAEFREMLYEIPLAQKLINAEDNYWLTEEIRYDEDYEPDDDEYELRKAFRPIYVNYFDHEYSTGTTNIRKFENLVEAYSDAQYPDEWEHDTASHYKAINLQIQPLWIDKAGEIVEEEEAIHIDDLTYQIGENIVSNDLSGIPDNFLYYKEFGGPEDDSIELLDRVYDNLGDDISGIMEIKGIPLRIEGKSGKKYSLINVFKGDQEIGDIELRIADHTYNPANNDDHARAGNFISVEIANFNKTQNRFLAKNSLRFKGDTDYDEIVETVKQRIAEIIEYWNLQNPNTMQVKDPTMTYAMELIETRSPQANDFAFNKGISLQELAADPEMILEFAKSLPDNIVMDSDPKALSMHKIPFHFNNKEMIFDVEARRKLPELEWQAVPGYFGIEEAFLQDGGKVRIEAIPDENNQLTYNVYIYRPGDVFGKLIKSTEAKADARFWAGYEAAAPKGMWVEDSGPKEVEKDVWILTFQGDKKELNEVKAELLQMFEAGKLKRPIEKYNKIGSRLLQIYIDNHDDYFEILNQLIDKHPYILTPDIKPEFKVDDKIIMDEIAGTITAVLGLSSDPVVFRGAIWYEIQDEDGDMLVNFEKNLKIKPQNDKREREAKAQAQELELLALELEMDGNADTDLDNLIKKLTLTFNTLVLTSYKGNIFKTTYELVGMKGLGEKGITKERKVKLLHESLLALNQIPLRKIDDFTTYSLATEIGQYLDQNFKVEDSTSWKVNVDGKTTFSGKEDEAQQWMSYYFGQAFIGNADYNEIALISPKGEEVQTLSPKDPEDRMNWESETPEDYDYDTKPDFTVEDSGILDIK